MRDMKAETIALWERVKRDGRDSFLTWLKTTDYFYAPASTQFHLSEAGGLMEHSLNVYSLFRDKVKYYNLNCHEDTIIICGLGHDLCKVNFYVPGTRNVKEGGRWVEKKVFKVEDQMPLGHGEKSVSILQDHFKLTAGEKLAIRWHMSAFDPGVNFNYPSGNAYQAAAAMTPLVTLLFTADYEATKILEAK